MTTRLRGAGATLLLGGMLALVPACDTGGAETSPSTSTAEASSTSAAPMTSTSAASTPGPTGRKAVAIRNAKTVLQRYFRVYDACMTHPKKAKMTCFDEVAIGTERQSDRNALTSVKAQGIKQIGKTKIVSIRRGEVDLTNKPKQSPPVIPTVKLKVCLDISDVNIVDAKGKSVVPPDRINRGVATFSVYNYQYPNQAKWRVGYGTKLEKDPSC